MKTLYKVITWFPGTGVSTAYYDTTEKAEKFLSTCNNGEIREVKVSDQVKYTDGCTWDDLAYDLPEIRVRNLVEHEGSKRVDWDVITLDNVLEIERVTHYHTNDRGEGLWEGEGYMKQKRCTWQFVLSQKTLNGKRQYIKRWFEKRKGEQK